MPDAVYQQQHDWFNQDQTRYEPAGDTDADYARWAGANMALIYMKGLADLNPDTITRADHALAERVDQIRGAIMMEIPGWSAFFSAVEYMLKSDNLNLSEAGKHGVRKSLEVLIRMHPQYEECKEGFGEMLEILDSRCPQYKRG